MAATGAQRELERNLRLYAAMLPASRLMFWAPVFFLYLNARFAIADVLLLEAIYYGAVVAIEVPSGYLSDRFGRVATLRLAMLSLALSYVLFLTGQGGESEFFRFAAAQVALAFGWAALSGTDTAFHHDTLAALGRSAEYAPREERLARNLQLAGAVSGVLGGAAAVMDLRAAYALSLGAALISLGLACGLREPPRPGEGWTRRRLDRQLLECVRLMRQPMLAWLLAYVVLMITAEHVPYEFAQPYLAAVLGEPAEAVRQTPLAAGLLIAGFKVVSAFAATRTLWLRSRAGLAGALLSLMALQCVVISAMAWTVHPLVLGLLLLRSTPPAMGMVLIHATVTPRLPQSLRATYLSIHSLAGRLSYGLLLVALSQLAEPGARAEPSTFGPMLMLCAAIAGVGTLALAWTRRALDR